MEGLFQMEWSKKVLIEVISPGLIRPRGEWEELRQESIH